MKAPLSLRRLKLNWIIGGLFILIFVFLLLLRVGSFERGDAERRGSPPKQLQRQKDRETWMNIYQQGEKIGYAHRQFHKTLEGWRIVESVLMQLNIMGMVQHVRFRIEGNFDHALTLSSFDFELGSNLFRFTAQGTVKEKVLTVLAGRPGSQQKIDLPFEKGTQLSVSLLEALINEGLNPGESRTFRIFDPTTSAHQLVQVNVLTEETIPIMGHEKRTKKVSLRFKGISHFAWIGEDGAVLKEEGPLGIRLEQVAKEEALGKIGVSSGADLAEVASIPLGEIFRDVTQLNELRIKLKGVEEAHIFLNGGRQSFKQGILRVRKESVSNLPRSIKREGRFEEGKTHLESTPLIQVEHPEIQTKAREIVSPDDAPWVKAKKLVQWVNENIQKRPVLSVPNALETLRHRVGDCNEHAVLLTALARASGIPAQVEAGLVYQRGRFYYHAWNVLYLGTWVTADAVLGQLPADVSHIRFVRGTEEQIDLVGFIGRMKMEILSHE